MGVGGFAKKIEKVGVGGLAINSESGGRGLEMPEKVGVGGSKKRPVLPPHF